MDVSVVGVFAAYVFLAYLALGSIEATRVRERVFATLNVVTAVVLISAVETRLRWLPIACFFGMIATSYVALGLSRRQPRLYYAALLVPIAWLAMARSALTPTFLGLSFLALRLSYLVHETREKCVSPPALRNYVAFASLPLTLPLGPISPYQRFARSIAESEAQVRTPLARALGRMVVGAVKCLLFAQVCAPLTFKGWWSDGYLHGPTDLVISCVASYLYLYFSFSGACDVVIGAARLLDLDVKENFANPLVARNIREFWGRFHVSLSELMRDLIFMPGLAALGRWTRGRWVPALTCFMLMINFFLIGIWHGLDWSFVLLGLLHGLAMVVFHLYSSRIERPLPAFLGVASTFGFVAVTSVCFDNDWDAIQRFIQAFTL